MQLRRQPMRRRLAKNRLVGSSWGFLQSLRLSPPFYIGSSDRTFRSKVWLSEKWRCGIIKPSIPCSFSQLRF